MFNFINKIKEKQNPASCDFCGAKVKRPVTAEVKTPPYMLNFCCHGCKIGYLTLDKGESSISDFISNDIELMGQAPVFKMKKEKNAPVLSFSDNCVSFGIKGVTCTSCIPVIEKALEFQENVISAKVNPVSHTVTLNFDEDVSNIKNIKKVLKKLGYSISEYDDSYDNLKEESYSLLARFGFGVFMSMNIMVFSLLLYSKYFLKLRSQIVNFSHLILWAFTSAIVLVLGYPIFKSALKKFISFTYNSDALISIGVLSAYIYSTFITFGFYKRSSGVFFDTAAMILILITFGKFLEASAKKSSLSGLHNLTRLKADSALLILEGAEKNIDIKDVKEGDILLVKSGDPVPTDGKLISEYAVIDESMFSGEPLPVNKKADEKIFAGSLNKGDSIKIKAESEVYKSYLFKMIRFAEKAYNMKIEPLRYIDEIAKVFVPVIIGVSILTFIAYFYFTGNIDLSITRFISVLVVACPCAFGLAAPLVITNAISKVQKDKILINGAETFEILNKADTVIFDKTGTITEGLPLIREVVILSDGVNKHDEAIKSELIQVAAIIEKNITDRMAEAFKIEAEKYIKQFGDNKIIDERNISDIIYKQGLGVNAKYNNTDVIIGNQELLKAKYVELSEETLLKALKYEKEGATVVYLSIGGVIKCLFVIADKIKDGAAEAVNGIIGLGKKVVILSGDSEASVKFIASALGISGDNAYFKMKPDDKLEFIKKLKSGKKSKEIVFIGDGLNDIPAMEESGVSILSPSKYEIPFNRSNVVLLDGNLKSIIELFKISEQVKKIIKENLLFSFIYNFIAIPLAVIGILNPLSAAASMMASSVFITVNSLKIRRHKKKLQIAQIHNEKIIQKTILNTIGR